MRKLYVQQKRMTQSDVSRIEQELGVQIPHAYATLLREYPFPEDSYVAESYLWNDPEFLIDSNTNLDSIIGNAKSSVCSTGPHVSDWIRRRGADLPH